MLISRRLSRGSYLVSLWHLSCPFADLSGADRTRTDDFLLAKQVLYQLSYRPGEMQKTRSKTPARPDCTSSATV